VKVLYVRNLTQDCSEEKLKESFEAFGKVERVKKIKDYAFIHFEDRDNAMTVCILCTMIFRPLPLHVFEGELLLIKYHVRSLSFRECVYLTPLTLFALL